MIIRVIIPYNFSPEQERLVAQENLASAIQEANVLPFLAFDKLPTEAFNAVRNFLANEIISVRHQIHYSLQHHRSLESAYQESVREHLARAKLNSSEDMPSEEADPLATINGEASGSGTQD